MINQAIHTIDLLTVLFGKPKKLWATKSNHHLKGIIDTEDSCEGLIEFENGKRGNFYATTSFTGGDKTILYVRTANHKIELSYPALIVDGKALDIDFEHSYIGKECYGTGHPLLIAKFYNALSLGEPSPVPLSSAQYAVKIIIAAYESCDEEILIN
jgi:predicted dehydrogenase